MKANKFYLTLFIFLLALAGAACGAAGNSSDGSAESDSAPDLVSILAPDESSEEIVVEVTRVADAPVVETEAVETTVDESAVEEAVEPAAEESQILPVQEEVPPQIQDLEQTLIDLYERMNPSVVHIFVYSEDIPVGTGTGFVYDNSGHIVTNNHVVEPGERYEVVFPNGLRVGATLTGLDADSDLAVIQAEALPENALPLTMGDSGDIQVGQFVIAIGNPFGQESSMSLGIISGLGRSLASQRIAEGGGRYSLPQVIQTDAPINPGNSGGPLINLEGEVVGVNAAIRSETASNSGVGFSIPVNAVNRVVPSLIENGEYVYPFLGVSINDFIDLDLQEQLNLPQASGAYVITAPSDGPAGQAGIVGSGGNDLPGGDLIIAIDDQPVLQFEDLLSYLVFETEVGQTVELTVIRDGEQMVIPVELGARP